MKNVLVATQLPEEGIDKLKQYFNVEVKPGMNQEQLRETLSDFEVLIIRSEVRIGVAELDAAARLEVIARPGAGLDNVAVEEAQKRGIVVMNTPGGNSKSVAELVIANMISLARNIVVADSEMKRGEWNRKGNSGLEIGPNMTVGIVGFGNVGKLVARYAKVFGARILAYDPFLDDQIFQNEDVERVLNLDDLLRQSEVVTLHVSKPKDGQSLIAADQIRQMKKGAMIINTSRGGVLNEADANEALNSGHLRGVAVDVFEKEPCVSSPLKENPRAILTPHLGASTEQAQERCLNELIDKLLEHYQKELAGLARPEYETVAA